MLLRKWKVRYDKWYCIIYLEILTRAGVLKYCRIVIFFDALLNTYEKWFAWRILLTELLRINSFLIKVWAVKNIYIVAKLYVYLSYSRDIL